MSKTVKEWEDNFQTLENRQQHQIVDALIVLADWPLFKQQYREHGLGELGVYLYKIAYNKYPSAKLIDKMMAKVQPCWKCEGEGKVQMYTDHPDSVETCDACSGSGVD